MHSVPVSDLPWCFVWSGYGTGPSYLVHIVPVPDDRYLRYNQCPNKDFLHELFRFYAPVMLPIRYRYRYRMFWPVIKSLGKYRFLFGKRIRTDGRIWLSFMKIFYINPCPTHFPGRYTSFKPILLMVFPWNWRSIEARSWLSSTLPASEERQRYCAFDLLKSWSAMGEYTKIYEYLPEKST